MLNTSKNEEDMKRKNIKINAFRFSPRTYRNLVEDEDIGESPIFRESSSLTVKLYNKLKSYFEDDINLNPNLYISV